MQPCQQRRIEWLKNHCGGTHSILEVGCSWGFILNAVGGERGVEINPKSIEKGRREFPHLKFDLYDVTEGIPYSTRSFDVVLLTEILEHIPWRKVKFIVEESLRVAKRKVLITLPTGLGPECSECFKHRWATSEHKIKQILRWLPKANVERDNSFVYIEVIK